MRRRYLLHGGHPALQGAPTPPTPAPFPQTRWTDAWLANAGGLALANSQKMTLILRFKQADETVTGRILRHPTGSRFNFESSSYLDAFQLLIRDTAGTTIVDTLWSPGSNWVAAGLWHTVAIAVDLTNPGADSDRIKWYWDGSPGASPTIATALNNGNSMHFAQAAAWEFYSGHHDGSDPFDADHEFLLLVPGVAMTQAQINAVDYTTISAYVGTGSNLLLMGDAASANGGTFEKGGVGTFTKQAGTVTDV